MRKRTKLVAVLSAAALLAMGASMTSFAAGWEKDDAGVWHYYDSDDEMVTGEWKKDGGKWFYLDDDGNMLTDSWVDDDYYVAEDGHMLTNEWKKTVSDDDQDDPDEDGESWYYFGSKGKKTTSDDKKINGKTYFFDEDGKMQYGWYADSNNNVYYLGEEDDGARTNSSWLWLAAPDSEDDDEKDAADAVSHDSQNDDDPCDEEGWYWFGSDGKMYKDAKQKKINGKYYYFNNHGQMLYEWINGVKANVASNAKLDSDSIEATASEVRYMNVVEEGWRADGWYQIDGADALKAGDDTDWYYFKDGKAKKADDGEKNNTDLTDDGAKVYTKKIKINGKNFCFNEIGQMQTGLQMIDKKFYYFDNDGYMKTGKIANVEEEDDNYTYYFETKNGKNGQGYTGEKSGYLYWNGKRLEADDDYRIYVVDKKFYLVNNKGKLQKSTSKEYDVENFGDDVKFTFRNTYEIASSTKDGSEGTYKNAATLPKIELFDNAIYQDALGVTHYENTDAYEAAQNAVANK